jgi:SAM-dependent methyltransferase
MKTSSSEPEHAGEARIRAAYGKRQADDARYSWFNPGHLFIVHERERRLLTLLHRHGFAPLNSKKILEIGCGTGYWLREFINWGARPENVTGIDLLPERLVKARQLCPPTVRIHRASAAQLPFINETFDLVFQATVFTSILDRDLKAQVAAEMIRVTKDNGLILWYDFRVNNPWNFDVRGVNRREIQELFPACRITLRRVTLAPPLARRLAPYFWTGCCVLEKIPWLRTHYLGVIQKRSGHELNWLRPGRS